MILKQVFLAMEATTFFDANMILNNNMCKPKMIFFNQMSQYEQNHNHNSKWA